MGSLWHTRPEVGQLLHSRSTHLGYSSQEEDARIEEWELARRTDKKTRSKKVKKELASGRAFIEAARFSLRGVTAVCPILWRSRRGGERMNGESRRAGIFDGECQIPRAAGPKPARSIGNECTPDDVVPSVPTLHLGRRTGHPHGKPTHNRNRKTTPAVFLDPARMKT